MKRIKRALAAFLRDELLEYIGYNHNIPYMTLDKRFEIEEIPFDTVVMETILPLEIEKMAFEQNPTLFEKYIEDCKKDFARKVMDHIHVDARNLTTDFDYMQRSVRFILRVQKKKQ